MRYSSTHKAQTRDELIDQASALIKAEGFAPTGVDALMQQIGLSGGSFYSYFPSKGKLFAAIIEREMENSCAMLAGPADFSADHVSKCLRSYLSNYHALHPETGCAISSLGPEIGRAEPEVKETVEKALRKLHASWSRRLEGDDDKAWGVVAQCIGTLVLSRCVASEKGRKEILASSRRFLERAAALKI